MKTIGNINFAEIYPNLLNYIPDFQQLLNIISASATTIDFIFWYKKFIDKKKEKLDHIENLFSFLENADFNTGVVPLDDRHSLQLFKRWFNRYFKNEREFLYYRDIGVPDINKDLCSIGGPVDHILTRHGMFYDKFRKKWEPILPYIFPLEEAIQRRESGEEEYTVKRIWKGKEWKTTNWYIADRYGERPIFKPEKDENGYLKTDYLMLIFAPNFLTDKAYKNGKTHLMIAPTHGLAQLAIEDALENKNVLEKLSREKEKSIYFQAVIKIPGKWKRNGYVPTGRFPTVVTKEIDINDFSKSPHFKEWLKHN